ncbi:hypothetical protein F511_13710 [Dorcoceras hygrometricum]|uniref:Uncharacterized protein n=1 Tax=Dorcoceras hygrometricum TaxID=472368 RepID=A0A2Z7B550_9LAMI|nr:hypothetical protein F511_13710 [Dorcoceras hygrometricum]
MKGGRDGKGPPSADLLICFPSRAHLTLMPKPICSPARPLESRNCQNHRPNRSRHLRRPSCGGTAAGRGHTSPLFWAKTKPTNSDISEPTSPKVTCAGQIKVRPKPSSCKNWQSVMEEIERLHNNKKQKKRAAWMEALGFKKDVMQFLTCLRSLRFDFRCFGSFPSAEITSDDDDDEDDDNEEDEDQFEDAEYTNGEGLNIQSSTGKMNDKCDESDESRTIFSKWFMILQQNTDRSKEMIPDIKDNQRKTIKSLFDEELMMEDDDETPPVPCVPPSNALLLMRCRSAPAKSWQEQKDEEEKGETDEEKEEQSEEKCEKTGNEESKESLVVMAYGADFSKFSSDIAKETWVVGGIRDLLSRSRSWKR